MRYIMSCGCVLDESGVKRKDNRLKCIEHGGIVLKRQGVCKNDGKVFFRGRRGHIGFLCDDCASAGKVEASRKKDAENRKKAAAKKAKKLKIKAAKKKPKIKVDRRDHSQRGDYCRNILSCINGKYPACLDCDKFYPVFKNVDPGRMVGCFS